jgi:hypothetical protein
MTDTNGRPDPNDDTLTDRLTALHAHLAATAELPVERTASALLGEAEAVAADLAAAGTALPADVRRERLGHVRDLLDRIDDTESAAADEHVSSAEAVLSDLLAE